MTAEQSRAEQCGSATLSHRRTVVTGASVTRDSSTAVVWHKMNSLPATSTRCTISHHIIPYHVISYVIPKVNEVEKAKKGTHARTVADFLCVHQAKTYKA